MKKYLFIATMFLAANAANAEMTLQEQIAADSQRDPYAESEIREQKIMIEQIEIVEEYIEPRAAEQMKPSQHFKLKNGNTVVKQ